MISPAASVLNDNRIHVILSNHHVIVPLLLRQGTEVIFVQTLTTAPAQLVRDPSASSHCSVLPRTENAESQLMLADYRWHHFGNSSACEMLRLSAPPKGQ